MINDMPTDMSFLTLNNANKKGSKRCNLTINIIKTAN